MNTSRFTYSVSGLHCLLLLVTGLSILTWPTRARALTLEKWTQRPKLAVVIVIDQCRSDFLTRYEGKMKMTKGGGLHYLKSKGAYFPFARYEILQSMTCPGHATILTGAYPYKMGIPINEWYDVNAKREVYCAEDSDSPIVGRAAKPDDGLSPKRLIGSTVGDELKIANDNLKSQDAKPKVVAVALKDRSAIMLGGHRADLALWVEDGQWETSKYYRPEGALPEWVKSINQKLKSDVEGQIKTESEKALTKGDVKVSAETVLAGRLGVKATTEAAIQVLKAMKLGRSAKTDILAISYSSHDMLGHATGLQSDAMEDLTEFENQNIGELIQAIEKEVGAGKVVFAFTGDHGVAPAYAVMKEKGMPAGQIDNKALVEELNTHLDSKWGSSSKGKWVLKSRSWNIYLNPDVMSDRKKAASDVEAEVKSVLLAKDGVAAVVTRTEVLNRKFTSPLFEKQIMNTYRPGQSGDVILIGKPFWVEKGAFATHMTAYSYDATVPLIFAGANVKPGVYAEKASVVDLAPTLSFILGLVPPSGAEGRVLHEIF